MRGIDPLAPPPQQEHQVRQENFLNKTIKNHMQVGQLIMHYTLEKLLPFAFFNT